MKCSECSLSMNLKMESAVESLQDEHETDNIEAFSTSADSWMSTQNAASHNNSTLLFIAVEYIKNNEKFDPDANFSEFDTHVSPLDPNMSSTARYSPIYTDQSVVVLPPVPEPPSPATTSSTHRQPHYSSPAAIAGNLLQQVVAADARYLPDEERRLIEKELQMAPYPVVTTYQQEALKVDPEQVELLITDQNTGISYSGYVSQDFLVNHRTPLPALPEDQEQFNNVLNTLESHGLVMETDDTANINKVSNQNSALAISDGQMMLQDPLLDTDLLLQAPVEIALDDSVLSSTNALVLKSNMNIPEPVELDVLSRSSLINVKPEPEHIDLGNNEFDVKLDYEAHAQHLRRSQRKNDKFNADVGRVQTISDKPVPSRARATLPATYLVINKVSPVAGKSETVYGVFARKAIPKRTQFGPLEGVRLEMAVNGVKGGLELLLESETGAMHTLDVSDENTSNWMRFVRFARTYNEQNLILSQQGYSLYYTTTRVILPRQELQVGYSTLYAAKRKLPTLQPILDDENAWPCFECSAKFATSDELQKHLNVHDENNKDEIPKSNTTKLKKPNVLKRRPIACPHCSRSFLRRHSLTRHLQQHNGLNPVQQHQIRRSNIVDKILEWKCDICNLYFPNSTLLNLHELIHTNEETITGLPLDLGSGCNEGEFLVHSGALQCPQCGSEYSNRKLLIEHVADHGKLQVNTNPKLEPRKAHKCYMCYKAFASRERLQRHMLVHGSDDSKPLKCETCSKRFLNNSALACHVKTQHKLANKKIFECPICKVAFDQILQLKEHVRTHCMDGVYNCPHCQKNFKEYSIIRKHIRAFHCDRKHGCQYCGKPFPTLDKLRMHLLKHSDHREFLCSMCGKQFKRKDKLKEHMKRMHSGDREPQRFTAIAKHVKGGGGVKKFMPKVQPTDYHRFIYKCHSCLLGFKRRGMLVNHLAKRHPDISPESVPELNLPILKTTRDYYCQYCEKVYKSSSKRKAHILKNHPGAELPLSNRQKGGIPEIPGIPNPTYSQTVGSVTTNPHACQWCHKQYASKAKLLQHQRKKHGDKVPSGEKPSRKMLKEDGVQLRNGSGNEGADVKELQQQAFKFTDESLLDDLEDCRPIDTSATGPYYRLIHLQSGDEEPVDDPAEHSRLYRLLTTSGPFPPYPPR